MKAKTVVLGGGFFGFLAVAMGAVADHVLRGGLEGTVYESLQTALRYMLVHAVLLVSLGLWLDTKPSLEPSRFLKLSIVLFFAGILFFSCAILLAVILHCHFLMKAAPFGGVSFMIGWLLLAVGILKRR